MKRYPYQKHKKHRPTLKAILTHRPPNAGHTAGGLGWEYVYPAPPPCRHEAPEPCDRPADYAACPPGRGRGGEQP
jgi:hypothetical protein